MSRAIDLVGDKYARLTVLELVSRDNKHTYWKCACDCGTETTVRGNNLRTGQVKSCGCLNSPEELSARARIRTKHGHCRKEHRSPTWRSWRAMRRRCSDPNNISYEYYGGRGITVCERWQSFENFLEDMGERPEGTTLDRIDPNDNYGPGKCRWATRKEQQNNRRPYQEWNT